MTEFSRPTAQASSTRERILREASILFTQHGYFGTSTRDIAGAVGIRQPSLFHHFDNKAAIAEELLEYAWGSTLTHLRRWLPLMNQPMFVSTPSVDGPWCMSSLRHTNSLVSWTTTF